MISADLFPEANFDPASGTLVFASDGSLEDRALVKPDKNNFAPRVAVAWTPKDRIVVRGVDDHLNAIHIGREHSGENTTTGFAN